MADLFDPAEYLICPGGGAATTHKAGRRPCSCGSTSFEWAVESRRHPEGGPPVERTTLRCRRCFARKPARILGHVDTTTLQTTEAPK